MQSKQAKGVFVDSSYQRTRLLKALLHGPRQSTDDEEKRGEDLNYPWPSLDEGKTNALNSHRLGWKEEVVKA